MALSVFDIFKIGVGPSSSHTMGPMLAANKFLAKIKEQNICATKIKVILYGSLALTGIGHATDKAVIVGLCGFNPQNIDADDIDYTVNKVIHRKEIHPSGHNPYQFDPAADLFLNKAERLPYHTNGMKFIAYDADKAEVLTTIYYSIGGGFVIAEDEINSQEQVIEVKNIPYQFNCADELLALAKRYNLTIAQIQRANEEATIGKEQLESGIKQIWQTMSSCIERGISRDGVLPGGLGVARRAKKIYQKLESQWHSYRRSPLVANEWLAVYAMAVNEENAIGGKVVTAPTNGAAGVIPAVLHYYLKFYDNADDNGVFDFFLTAAAIGSIIKQNASISGAEVGCQGEIGSASSMAAAGLTAAIGGTSEQIENAAEIALEHHLGMTCDPVNGLVQVPCIERNAFGAIKAVAATSLAMYGDGKHFMPLDNCVKTMLQTGLDMDERYKETSAAGLAVNIVAC